MSTSTGKQISRSASLAVRMVLVAVFTPTVALGLLAAVIVLLPRLCLTKALREQLTLQSSKPCWATSWPTSPTATHWS